MNKLTLCSTLITLTFLIALPSYANKVALVIGNSAYKQAPLTNPANDANDIATKLRRLNFEVILVKDATKKEMRQAVRTFDQKLRTSAGVGLFYYAGHGMQVDGTNYLIPLGASIQQSYDVSEESVSANYILKAMEASGNKLNIVILDACRNNPFARGWRSGTANGILARMDAPTGSIIAYATGPGDTAEDGDSSNGTYTKHLLKNMDVPGLSIEEVFKKVRIGVIEDTAKKQVPWESNSLTGNFYFIENLTIAPNKTPVSEKSVSAPLNNEEITYWNTIKSSNNPRYFKAYMDKYGDKGQFTSIAKIRRNELIALQKAPTVTATPASTSKTDVLYAALAINGNQGDRWGFSADRFSASEANQQALLKCGSDCTVVKNFANGCGAYAADQASGSTIWGFAQGKTPEQAKDKALASCLYYKGTQCIIRVWVCNSH
ncbi:MAG: caspase family protein [Methylococcales bacterium]|nr:caspase family protein [Methylococcales bacterium]